MKPTKDMKKVRRQQLYMNWMRKKKLAQEQLLLETTSIKDLKRQAMHDTEPEL